MSIELDRLFFRNFTLVVILLAVMMCVFGVIASWASSYADQGRPTGGDLRVADRLAPVGQVRMAHDEPVPMMPEESAMPIAGDPTATADGKGVYGGLCVSCHGSGIPNIPQLGDKTDWAPRIAQGVAVLYDHAINGYTGSSGMLMPMPAKGGNPALSDAEVQAAVDYMVSKAQ